MVVPIAALTDMLSASKVLSTTLCSLTDLQSSRLHEPLP